MIEFLDHYTPLILSMLALAAASLTSIHVILSRREPGSSVAWIGLAWLVPLLGSALYLILGVNRIQRRAAALRRGFKPFYTTPDIEPIDLQDVETILPQAARHLSALPQIVGKVVKRPLLPGTKVDALFDGDGTYPAMLEAIANAEHSISLVTYIFDRDTWGLRFAQALSEAVERGVEVRVLIDAAGMRYSFPTIMRNLKRGGVRVARFLPSVLPPHIMTVNLRNHRKIMVVDGKVGFTGGINIRESHVLHDEPGFPTRDIHFRVQGPVVAHLQEVFVTDWEFSTREALRGESWFPKLEPVGKGIARGIPDGPDEDFDKLRWTLLGALTCAKTSVRIVTPYFVPDTTLITCINLTATRGVKVDVVLPATNNLPYVRWASMSLLRPLLHRDVRIWLTPPPFNHSKLMVVDRQWILFGSANWDARSLRLNFEFNVESFDAELAEKLDGWIEHELVDATRLTLEDYDARSNLTQLRDGAAGLLAPYL